MADDRIYVWVRWRRNTSASAGTWAWHEWPFPPTCNTKRKQLAYFKKQHGPALNDEQDSGSEQYRGVEWEFAPVTQEILRSHREGLKKKRAVLALSMSRYAAQIMTAPTQIPNPEKVCRQFPGCGCLKEFKTKDCRAPFSTLTFGEKK